MLRVAISGFGRIGRCLVWAIHERGLENQIQVVAINDLVEPRVLSHLLRHDTTHGHFRTPVALEGDRLSVGNQNIVCLSEKDPAQLPWNDLGVDVVLECTGKMKKRELLSAHLDAGEPAVCSFRIRFRTPTGRWSTASIMTS